MLSKDWIDQARKQREIDFEPKYGPIHPRTDSRCFRREMIEELLDALNYAQWAKEKGEINLYKWKKANNTLRFVIHLMELSCEDSFWWRVEIQRPCL
jgi:hypothetical protein